jgi:hypothetical protein
MKKLFLLASLVILIALLAGCDQIPQLGQLREAYVQTRVVQLVTQMVTQAPAEGTAVAATEEARAVETSIVEQPTATLLSFPKDITITPTVLPPTAEPTLAPTEVPTAEPTFTPIPTQTPLPLPTLTPVPTVASTDPAVYLGKAVWKDTFDENKGWAVDTDEYASVSIYNGAMTLTAKSSMDAWRLAPTDSLGNNYVEAMFTPGQCDPNDHFGLIFRMVSKVPADQGYQFGITCDGRFLIRKVDLKSGPNGTVVSLLPWTPSAEIRAGANQTNRIGIMTINDRLVMFINGVAVGEVKDTTYPQGFIGVFLGSRVTKNFTVRVDDLAYWKNPTTP